jgi:hypothetical protein
MWHLITVILGLAIFEVISSLDNAVVNAHVLQGLPQRFRKFFLTWGMIIAVVLVRGVLPFIIVWIANPSLSLGGLWQTVWSGSAAVEEALKTSKPLLLIGGGTYLVLVFLGWLFLEKKSYAFLVEHFLHRQSAWFYAIVSVLCTVLLVLAMRVEPAMALAASIGSTMYFVTDGFRKNAEATEEHLQATSRSAWSSILYLEVLDASFSIDGVIGAFAFTMSVPLILLGNGLGALIVRQVTVHGLALVQRYAYLKNGAMYSLGMLGGLMVFESFGHEYPFWVAPVNTVILLVVFLTLSEREIQLARRQI